MNVYLAIDAYDNTVIGVYADRQAAQRACESDFDASLISSTGRSTPTRWINDGSALINFAYEAVVREVREYSVQ